MKAYFKLWFAVLTIALAVLVVVALTSRSTRAAGQWYVTPGGDDGNDCLSPGTPCATINGAVGKASSGDTIFVATGTYTGIGDQVVLLGEDVTLSGGWDGTFTAQAGTSTLDGEVSRRGMTVNSDVLATIERFAIQNGSAHEGGGIYNWLGTVILNNSTVTDNTSASRGSGIFNAGELMLNNSTVSDNGGSGIFNGGPLVMTNSTVSGNVGGGIKNESTLTLYNSIISGNTANGDGGGIWNGGTLTIYGSTISDNMAGSGGGIYNPGGTLNLNNSTLSGNTANGDGGAIKNFSSLTLNNSTVSGNMAQGSGGGISSSGGTATLKNSVLAKNTANTSGADCNGTIGSSGYNLIGDTSGCTFSLGPGELTDVDPNLGPLLGPSSAPWYHPLLLGSPAIDAGNPAGCTDHLGDPLDTDQRGAPRVGRCDIGAYEYTTPGPADSIFAFEGTPQRTPLFFPFDTPLQALVLDSIGSPVDEVTVTFSGPTSGASGTFADSGTHTTTALADERGLATATTFTANGLQGEYTVTATVNGVVNPALFVLRNIGWYVSPSGDDVNDCQTPTTPCATVNGVLGKPGFVGGDTIVVAIGTYTGTGDEVVLLDKGTTLSGGWDETFTAQVGTSTIDGEETRRGMTVNSGVMATVEHFTIKSGSAYLGGGIYNQQFGTLTLNNSSIQGNSAPGGYGGGVANNAGTLILNNSTVSGNRAGDKGGGISNQQPSGTLTLNNSTLSGNSAWRGGGVDSDSGAVTLQNTILAGNTASYSGPDCSGTLDSAGYNLVGDTMDCTFTPTTGDLLDMDARLFPLIGLPGYHPLLPDSPAIDGGNPAGCTDHLGDPLTTDQRGSPRPWDGDGDGEATCDIGSYELDPDNNPLTAVYLPVILRSQ